MTMALPVWLRSCTIDFPWAQGQLWVTLEKAPTNMPLKQACWAQSVFQGYDHLILIFVLSLGIENIITHIEALTKFNSASFE